MKQKLKNQIETELINKGKSAPRLAVILVGNNMASKVYVSGNTTMLHILANVNPEALGTYPFTSLFTL